ncbi:FA8-like protein [Mya arenaria]|uniref:FA8-like protein n=1 Tax=Mya arenaria TaxID=6604 RepID=A0ABY7FGM8_MYAAR|nr:FA8-like protein [Mya arenaria]
MGNSSSSSSSSSSSKKKPATSKISVTVAAVAAVADGTVEGVGLVTGAEVTLTPDSCNVSLTSSLRDDQFTASSQYSDRHNATAARFNSVGWIASTTGTQHPYEYLQVNFDATMQLTSLNFTGANTGWYPSSIRRVLSYSDDGLFWRPYTGRLSTDSLGQLLPRTAAVTSVNLDPPILAQRLAINVVEMYGYASLRMELFGCQATNQVPLRAGTVVNQDIQVDTTWIPNQNPFIIDRHLIVRPGVTLTLQAGVNVVFKSAEVGIDVFGTLVTEGLTGLRTVFTSTFPVIARSSMWTGLSQKAGGKITLRYSLVRQAKHGISGNGSSVRLMNTEVHSCIAGIRLAGGAGKSPAQPILFGMSIHTNEYGIQLHGTVEAPTVYIENSKVDRNTRSGITVSKWAAVDPSTPNLDSFTYTWDSGMNAFVAGGVISSVASIPTLTDIDVVVNRSVIVLPGAQITMTGVAVNFTDDRGVIAI